MNPAPPADGNLLINGAFHPDLWTRLARPERFGLPCPVGERTYAADRWRVRYGAPEGAEVTQTRREETPTAAGCSLEIQGAEGVSQPIFVGQDVEASEASAYRRFLRFTVWCWTTHPSRSECPVRLVVGSPQKADFFHDESLVETVAQTMWQKVPVHTWTPLSVAFDATGFRPTGLRVELELPASILGHAAAGVRMAEAALYPAESTPPLPRPFALEAFLARRYFQRHDACTQNAIGRALLCNTHELHFQFAFPEMRAFPAVTLPHDNADLCVFSRDGLPQTGFVYDVSHTSRGSAIIRATKLHHGLGDGYLAFRGHRGSILLDAEL